MLEVDRRPLLADSLAFPQSQGQRRRKERLVTMALTSL